MRPRMRVFPERPSFVRGDHMTWGKAHRIGAIALLVPFLSAAQCMQVREEPLVLQERAPEPVQVSATVPVLEPVQEQQRQEKGAVTILLEPVPFSATRNVRESKSVVRERYVDRKAGQVYDIYSVKHEPYYSVSPEAVMFKVRIINNHQRILRLEGTVVTFAVDGKDVAVPSSNYADLLQGILTPRSEKEFVLTGPRTDQLSDGSTIAVNLYDVVTRMDQAGTITEKSNFEWYFKFGLQQKIWSETITYRYDKRAWQRVRCSTCQGSGAGGLRSCSTCDGTGYVRYKKKTRECSNCGGRGVAHARCSSCDGNGYVFIPPDGN